MKLLQICWIVLSLLCGHASAEEKKTLPSFSFERFFDVADGVRATKFPIKIGALCEKLGGDNSVRMASARITGEQWIIYFNITDDVSEKGVFQLQVSASKQEGPIASWVCSAPRLLYLREGIDFYFPNDLERQRKPANQPLEPTAGSGRGSP